MKYQINFYDYENGATSEIDVIEARKGYTAEEYVDDCLHNASDDWNVMLEHGKVTIEICPMTMKEIFENYYDELTQKERDIITTTDGDCTEFESLEDFKEYIAVNYDEEV